MKIIITIVFALVFLGFSILAKGEELTLFNSLGDPIAYIDTDDEDLTIYMWNGTPVAYLVSEGSGFHIYGFNGTHLGWFDNGIVRDHNGYIVGFIEGAVTMYTKYEPYKSYKQFKPYKSYRSYAPYKPYYYNQFSNEPLSLFLLRGKS